MVWGEAGQNRTSALADVYDAQAKGEKKNFAGIPNKSSNLFSHVFSSEIRWNFGLKAVPTHSRNRTGTHLKPR